MHEIDDDGLVRSWRDGHHEAAEVLVRRHGPSLLRYLRRLAGPDDSEDLLQETFATFFGSVERYKAKGLLKAYLFRIAGSRARDRARRLNRQPDLSLLNEPISKERGPEDCAQFREHFGVLHQALAELPSSQRQAVVLATWEGMDYAGIAESVGCTLAAVKQRIFRAREHLRARMLEQKSSKEGN